jgi:predicted amino acid racemase
MYPRVDIDLAGVLTNFRAVTALARARGVSIGVVTKALAGYRPLVEALVGAGATAIGEAHLHTLDRFADLPADKWMIRLPLPSQADQVVRLADISLNTERRTLAALGQAAVNQGKRHKVVLMVDLGETREGVVPEELVGLCQVAAATEGLELYGIGTELGCYSDIVPSAANMGQFADLVRQVEDALGVALPVASGGSSSALGMLAAGQLPAAVNQLRVGETILTGRVANFLTPLPGGVLDPFTLSAEIIEIQHKPSLPRGARVPGEVPIGDDPRFPDRGPRRRALVAIGKQDVGIDHLVPHDRAITLLGGSSDITIADLTDCDTAYQVGDILTFAMDYYAILPAMVSSFVEKNLIRRN